MGIPGFFNSISKNYNIGIGTNTKISYPNVYIDFNSLIYTAKYIVQDLLLNFIKSNLHLEYNTDLDFSLIPNPELLIKKELNSDAIQSMRDEMIFSTIALLISNILIQTIEPKVFVYLDGVPFIGKMIEQRKRSLLSGLIIKGKELIISNTKPDETSKYISTKIEPLISLDKNVIKPGTFFMSKLMTWLESKYPNFHFNDYLINGEAEHKIMDDIINGNLANDILVYSPDADMIVLLLPLTLKKHIYLVRDSVDKTVYSLDKLKQDIIDHFKTLIKKDSIMYSKLDQVLSRLIYDICFIYNIFGNDFLPKLDNVNIYDKSTITRVLTQYIYYLNESIKQFDLKNIFLITETNNVNWYGYTMFLDWLNKEFAHPKIEKPYSVQNKLDPLKFSDQMYSLNNFGRGLYTKNPDKYIWNSSFYSLKTFFETSDLDHIMLDYFIGIIMIDLLYSKIYTSKLTVEEKQMVELWYYPHHKAPLIQDIYLWLEKFITNKAFNIEKFKKLIRSHLVYRLKKFPKIFKPDYQYQLYYITPDYNEFVRLVNPDQKKYPKLKFHELYEEFVKQLEWSNNKLNLSDLIDCNSQRFIDKCVPLLYLKTDNTFINLVFDPVDFII
jgi:5'-3' exonuclease